VISYRHHIVSLVAVFLALAVGVVLGGGPLTELGRADTPAASGAATQRASQRAERGAAFGDDFAAAGAATLYGGRLEGQAVSILTLPGAAGEEVSALGAQVEAAGGTVAGTYDARPALVSASEKSLVDTLGSQLMTQLGTGAVSADAPTYERLGELLAIALGASDSSAQDTTSVRQSLAGAELLTSPPEPEASGLVLVVLGDESDDAILSGLMTGLAGKAAGVVVAGDTESGASGDLKALRGEDVVDDVATVDGVDTGIGQVTAVLALARSIRVQGGSFGASGSDGAVPLG
jgi:hypothetical protein